MPKTAKRMPRIAAILSLQRSSDRDELLTLLRADLTTEEQRALLTSNNLAPLLLEHAPRIDPEVVTSLISTAASLRTTGSRRRVELLVEHRSDLTTAQWSAALDLRGSVTEQVLARRGFPPALLEAVIERGSADLLQAVIARGGISAAAARTLFDAASSDERFDEAALARAAHAMVRFARHDDKLLEELLALHPYDVTRGVIARGLRLKLEWCELMVNAVADPSGGPSLLLTQLGRLPGFVATLAMPACFIVQHDPELVERERLARGIERATLTTLTTGWTGSIESLLTAASALGPDTSLEA